MELATGKESGRLLKVGDGFTPLVACNDKLVAGLNLIQMDPANFKDLGQIKVSRETFTPVHFSEGRLYVRGRLPDYAGQQPSEPGCIYCVDLRK